MSTLDGSTFASFGLVEKIEQDIPMLSETRDKIVEIPERDGAYDFGADMGPRSFKVPLAWKDEISTTALQAKIRTFAAFLMDASGKPRNMVLQFYDETEKYYIVRYSGSLPIQRLLKYGFFDLPLLAYDPFAYAVAEAYDETYLYDVGLEYDTGLIYPNARFVQDWSFLAPTTIVPIGDPRMWAGFVWMYSTHFSSQHNYGAVETPLIVEISGDVINPTITSANGDTITITTTLVNQTLLIDGNRKIVTIDGVNALSYLTGDFITMDIGENLFTFTGASPLATVTYQWLNKFV
jgi:phage-related protein